MSSTTIGAAVSLLVMCGCSQLLALDDSFQLGPSPVGGGGGIGGTGGSTNVGGETTGGSGGAATGGTGGTAAGGQGGIGGTAGGGQGGTGGTAGGGIVFFDDFERPDGPNVGNGWIEKIGGAFSLVGGRAAKASTPSTSYRANMVYRPPAEAVLDVEAMVEFDILGPNVFYPQLFVRAQTATIATPNEYVGYLLYVSGSATDAVLGRQGIGVGFVTTLQSFSISPALTTGEIYRLTLKAEGTDPVQLSASIQRFTGSSWEIIGTAAHDDGAAERIDAAGTVGFSGDESPDFSYDNFTRTDL